MQTMGESRTLEAWTTLMPAPSLAAMLLAAMTLTVVTLIAPPRGAA